MTSSEKGDEKKQKDCGYDPSKSVVEDYRECQGTGLNAIQNL